MKRGNNYSGTRRLFAARQSASYDPNVLRFTDGTWIRIEGNCPNGGRHIHHNDQPCKCGQAR